MQKIKFTKKHFLVFLAILLLALNFQFNVIDQSNTLFETFHDDLVNNSIQKAIDGDKIELIGLAPYDSTFGLQGHVFYFLALLIPTSLLGVFHVLCSFLMAVVSVAICIELNKAFDSLLSIVFYSVMLLSPWVVSFARVLFFVEFTWFIPIYIGLLYYNRKKDTKIYYILMFVSILIRALCGYEYITSILISAMAIPALELFKKQDKKEFIIALKKVFLLGVSALSGVIIALLIHSVALGDGDIINGIQMLYEKSTYRMAWDDSLAEKIVADRPAFDLMKESFDASAWEVFKIYFFDLYTPLVKGIDGNLLPLISLFSLLIAAYNCIERKTITNDTILFIIYFISAVSWYVLAAPHSYIHTFMNYVLWYLGYVQLCFYIIIKYVLQISKTLNLKK